MKNLYVLIGLPGSGKSTYAKTLEGKLFSSDDYRKKITGDSSDQSANDKVFKQLYSDIHETMKTGEDCIFDATNCTYKSRTRIIELALKYKYFATAVVVYQPIDKCITWDTLRSRSVGSDVIWKYAKSFQFPQYEEGFDSIRIVRPDCVQLPYGKATMEFLSHQLFDVLKPQLDTFEQHNPYHTLTVGKHSDVIVDQATKDFVSGDISLNDFAVLLPAGLWHDCGKLYTQTFDENGIAHYYGHDSVSVLRLLDIYSQLQENTYSQTTVYKIFFVINNHMKFKDVLNSEKATNKFISKWGNDNFELMKRFFNYDMNACKKCI